MAYDKLKSENYANLGGINTKASPFVTNVNQFLDLTNVNFSTPGSLTKREGTTLYIGVTVAGVVGGLYEFERLSGFSQIIMTANTNAYSITGGIETAIKTGLLNNAIFDFQTFVDRLFMANGQDLFKYDGTVATNVGLPQGITAAFSVTTAAGGGFSGIFSFAYGYLNDRGYFGPACPGITLSLDGGANSSVVYNGLTAPGGFGITAISLYHSQNGLVTMFGSTNISAGATTFTETQNTITTRQVNFNIYLGASYIPQHLEIYNNQMFYSGFSGLPSTVFWSQIGEPEGIDPTFFAEFRTNDGDRITGLKYYNGSLIVTKQRSFHRVVGDNPTNFLLQEISDQYGCLNNRSLVTFENVLLFLDSKGVIQFNGANLDVISNEIEPIIKSMNIPVAKQYACAVHDRLKNQVKFSIPCNGASFNNCTIVYDYLVKAWTKEEGYGPASMAIIQGALAAKTVFFGSYSGAVFNFDSTLFGDYGPNGPNALTCVIKSRFISEIGQSVQKQYRRLFLNADPVGSTQSITVKFFQDYGASVVSSQVMGLAVFQQRIDFGISAKALAFQMEYVSASFPFKLHGFTIESRFQRAV